MLQTFKLSNLKIQIGKLLLGIFEWLVIGAIIAYVLFAFPASIPNEGLTILGLAVFFLLTVGAHILFVLFLNSYRVTIANGSITETQMFRAPRVVSLNDITQIKWSYF